MWIFPVARLCIGQDAGYRNTVLGQWLMQERLNFKSSEFDDCAREKKWIPRKVCDELMSLDSEEALSPRNLARLGSQYASELRVLNVAGEYFMAFEKAESAGTAVPSCPRSITADTPSQRVDTSAALNTDNLGAISDHVGTVNAWRLIPGVLLAHCAKEAPQSEPSMRATYDSWRHTNESLISSIDRIIDQVAPLYASALAISDSEAKDRMTGFTTERITDTYLKNDKISVSQVCADYDKIVAELSSPGRVAATRGLVYAVEGMVAARKSRSSRQTGATGKAAK